MPKKWLIGWLLVSLLVGAVGGVWAQVKFHEVQGGSAKSKSGFQGSWRGQVYEENLGAYPAILSLEDRGNAVSGSISYPTLECGGRLIFVRFEGKRLVVKEKIDYGECFGGGTVHITNINENSLKCEWYYPLGKRDCNGIFYREP